MGISISNLNTSIKPGAIQSPPAQTSTNHERFTAPSPRLPVIRRDQKHQLNVGTWPVNSLQTSIEAGEAGRRNLCSRGMILNRKPHSTDPFHHRPNRADNPGKPRTQNDISRKTPASGYAIDEAFDFDGPGTHLCQAWNYQVRPDGTELALMGFGAEGSTAPSFIIGTRDGLAIEEIWRDAQSQPAGYGIRSIVGPLLNGEIVIASNDQRDSPNWSEWRGKFPY